MVVLGTRPEAIKLAPVIRGLEGSPHFSAYVALTAQHREMVDQVLSLFAIRPRHDLNIIQPGQSLTELATRALTGLSGLIVESRPDAVVVQGDTATTFAGALAAFYAGVPVVHVEAGLRTHHARSPFPEEINRRLTTQVTALHLAPTPTNRDNLLAEGVDPSGVVVTGNTVIDALLWAVEQSSGYGDAALADLDDDPRRVLVVTAHRRESWGEPMQAIGRALAELAGAEPDLLVVFPVHRNPVVRQAILPAVDGLANVRIIEPLSYGSFATLMRRATILLTDSGGIQEEGPCLGRPVLVMRDTTERPEAVYAGTVRLVGTDQAAIVAAVRELLHDEVAYAAMARAINPYGDGRAAERTVAAMAHLFGVGPPAVAFDPMSVCAGPAGRGV
ncbi:MAG: non-hydrolyzing UDP-N-acetylglucosamine 2-epimerase [Acidimicrobiales bacterium]